MAQVLGVSLTRWDTAEQSVYPSRCGAVINFTPTSTYLRGYNLLGPCTCLV